MRNRTIALSALAAALLADAAGATTWAISSSPFDYRVNGWALHCESSTTIFDRCEAVKAFGPATVKIRTHPAVIEAEVGRRCRSRTVDGEELEWPLSYERIDLIIKRIQDETDTALRSCGKAKLSEAARLDIHTMTVLVYGLRADR